MYASMASRYHLISVTNPRSNDGIRTQYHAAGTAAMGKVVDSSLRVMGVEGLRIVDASVLPLPLACHYQACIFALGERAADIILGQTS